MPSAPAPSVECLHRTPLASLSANTAPDSQNGRNRFGHPWIWYRPYSQSLRQKSTAHKFVSWFFACLRPIKGGVVFRGKYQSPHTPEPGCRCVKISEPPKNIEFCAAANLPLKLTDKAVKSAEEGIMPNERPIEAYQEFAPLLSCSIHDSIRFCIPLVEEVGTLRLVNDCRMGAISD